jgi:hypothetical protein
MSGNTAANLNTRKTVGSLTLADFAAFPLWEYASDEEGAPDRDETWVRPFAAAVVPLGAYSIHVAADFLTASGRMYSGFVTASTPGGEVDICQGVILDGASYLFIPNPEMVLFQQMREELISTFGEPQEAIFPISYTLRIRIAGETGMRCGCFH